jgi:hypothetical protein
MNDSMSGAGNIQIKPEIHQKIKKPQTATEGVLQ